MYKLISTQDDFESFIISASKSSVVGIDTEFLREKTYYPHLCLLQMAFDDEVALIDPFAIESLAPLDDILLNKNIMKVFHAATQDLEIIYNEMGHLPNPIFDTQCAASLLGHSQQIGYGSLVKSVLDITLDKSDSYTDWSRRPLNARQLQYAADDVTYLPRLYEHMRNELECRGRLHWLDDDFAEMLQPARYETDPQMYFRRLKRVGQLSRHQLAAAREAAAWREEQARERDIPRRRVLSDEQIVEMCKRNATTIDELFMVRGVRERLGTGDARRLASLMKAAYELPPDQWPEPEPDSRNERSVDTEVDIMNALVRIRAKENDIAPSELACRSDLASVARGYSNVNVLKGWRRKIVGNDLLDFIKGEIALTIKDGSVEVMRVGGQ